MPLSTFFSVSLILAQVHYSFTEELIIELPNGKILGREYTTIANTPFRAFQKIPYASPPIGELRFKAPQPPQNWEGLLDATTLDVSCFQLGSNSITDFEDCLFLNVYTPKLPINAKNVALPVMLYIHGGGFTQGSSILAPPDSFVDNGVILVTINYRLGPFGFLSTEDEVIPGNNGLKDQHLAIQWTHDNIHLFGGDPEKITVFGQSAGSASIAYQLLNQNSEGLFRSVILESGVSISSFAYQRRARSVAFHLGALLNSTFDASDDSEALLQFLQSVEAENIDAAAEKYLSEVGTPWDYNTSQGSYFGPVIEVENSDAFLTEKMYGLLQEGRMVSVPTLIGFNSEESLLFNQDPDVLQSTLEAWDQNLDLIVPDDMQITDPDAHLQMAHQIRDIYTNGEPFGTNLGAGIRYSSDNAFTKAIIKYAELTSGLARTYFYQFSYDGVLGYINVHYDGAESVGHSEEAFYLFCLSLGCNFGLYPENDQITQRRLIKIWTDFAKYQNPTPITSDLLQNITWPQLSLDGGDFLYLDIGEKLEVKNHPKDESYRKWTSLYNSLNYSNFDTY